MLKNKKFWISIAIVMIVIFIFSLYNAFNGNPISKFLAKKALDSYVEETYPEKEFNISEGFYNFKFGEYTFNLLEIGNWNEDTESIQEYEFTVRGTFFPEVYWDGLYYDNLDERLMERLSKEASEEIFDELIQQNKDIIHVGVSLEVLKGRYNDDVNWKKELELDRPISLYIVIDAENKGKDDIYMDGIGIQKQLKEKGYHYDNVNINANIMTEEGKKLHDYGYVKYALAFEQNSSIKKSDVNKVSN
ncbi:DUF3139 domain-containing protein [Evansella cellulosilytica]|uniref:Uncharacterized protein n=1 Tax=Evansella cellulosilytica (strain ATCC 21833 / DSM 2522 / FERM P-1141 / JCM 9156 / N-4) TaxID=649639 RepID=E6TQT9_EVAC2|nr:DUF3139 domain-containing protein [Evansella cellulosilytica]ADU31714.1 hypothetical protein Bcell_3472 [Evansella cellulosilytica DSM 2522]